MKQDSMLVNLIFLDFQSFLIELVVDSHFYGEARFGLGVCKDGLDLLIGEEDFSGGRMMHLSEESVLDGVPFGTVRGVMHDHDSDADVSGDPLQFFLEGVMSIAVCPSAITKQEDFPGIGIEVDAKFFPPPNQVVADHLGGFVIRANTDVALVEL